METKPDNEPHAVQARPTKVVEPQAQVMPQVMPVSPPVQNPSLLKISGIGYGAESTFAPYTPGQRRLMAIRSSKLDAYRALAEQLYGIKIDSNTSVSTLTAKNDSFRARVNAVVRDARDVSVTQMAEHNYDTGLEVYVAKKLFDDDSVYIASTAAAVYRTAAYKVSAY